MNAVRFRHRQLLLRAVPYVAIALLGTSCSLLTNAVNDAAGVPTSTSEPAVIDAPLETGSDGPVSFDEYSAGLDALAGCMLENRAELTARVLDPITGIYTYDYDPVFAAVHAECYELHFADLDSRYRSQPTYNAELVFDGDPVDLSAYEPDSWVHLLARIPDTADTRFHPVTIVDLDRTRATFGIDLPSASAPDSAVETYRADLAVDAGLLPVGPLAAFGRLATPAERRLELGFDSRAWDALVEAGQPDMSTQVFVGRFDPATIDEAVHNDPNWSGELSSEPLRSTTLYSWGIDGGIDLELASPVRPIGEFRKLALFDNTLVWVRHDHQAAEVAEALDGVRRSLADVESIRRLAERADELGLHSALITKRFAGFVGNSDPERAEETFVNQPEALLIGDGADRKGPFIAFSFVYEGITSAENNVAAITQRIEQAAGRSLVDGRIVEADDVRRTDIWSDGEIVEARIWLSDDPLPPIDTIIRFDFVPGLGDPLPMVDEPTDEPATELSQTR